MKTAGNRERIRELPVLRAVELVVPPAVEARGANGTGPFPERDHAFAGPHATGPLVSLRRARRAERVAEVDAGDDPRIEPSHVVRRRPTLVEVPEVEEDLDVGAV